MANMKYQDVLPKMTTQIRSLMPTNQFKRDVKKHLNALISSEWAEVIYCLTHHQPLPQKYQDHALNGNFDGFRDCHIKPDLVLIYALEVDYVQLVRLGSHAELF